MRTAATLVLATLLSTLLADAQWLSTPDPSIPRTADGKPNLAAPTPHGVDGRPDLSGVWVLDTTMPFRYLANLAADFAPNDVPMHPWAEALTKERASGQHATEFPAARCLPQGIPILNNSPAADFPFKIVHTPRLMVVLYEAGNAFRQIFLDGRSLPVDPNPTWLGYSVGRWEGDALVIVTSGFNGRSWLDLKGHPSTESLRITERFRRPDLGHLQLALTIDDPKTYLKPWTVDLRMRLLADTDILEYVCNENEKDLAHMVVK
jgi:hypothetical protein